MLQPPKHNEANLLATHNRVLPCQGRTARCGADATERVARSEKLSSVEAKLRGALTDKAAAQSEKATAERSLKMLQSQSGRMAKDLEKQVHLITITSCTVGWLYTAATLHKTLQITFTFLWSRISKCIKKHSS